MYDYFDSVALSYVHPPIVFVIVIKQITRKGKGRSAPVHVHVIESIAPRAREREVIAVNSKAPERLDVESFHSGFPSLHYLPSA